jgi:hypothetical protein
MNANLVIFNLFFGSRGEPRHTGRKDRGAKRFGLFCLCSGQLVIPMQPQQELQPFHLCIFLHNYADLPNCSLITLCLCSPMRSVLWISFERALNHVSSMKPGTGGLVHITKDEFKI